MGSFEYHCSRFFIVLCLSLALTSFYPCYFKCKRVKLKIFFRLFLLNLIPTLWYILLCPIYNGNVFTQLSDNRDPIDGNTVRSWGDTFACHPKEILYPKSSLEVQEIVKRSKNIRVVGGGHSFSPLVCTNETLLSLRLMDKIISIDDQYVVCESGSTIESLQTKLLAYEKIIHGFGSIQDQSLAGAFSTSHHGLTFHSFAEDVSSITAVLANGTMINTSKLFFWRAHMGMLGVITSVKLRLYTNTLVNIETEKLSLHEALKRLPLGDAGIIETNFNQKSQGLLKTITTTVQADDEKYPVKTNHFKSAFWDTVVVPLVVLFPFISEFPLLDFAGNKTLKNVPMVEAWSHHSEYGMMYSAYAIPYYQCEQFIEDLSSLNKSISISTILIRYVHGQNETTCLTFAPENACVVDIYDLQSQDNFVEFHYELEKLVNFYGGVSHWGKFYAGNMSRQTEHIPCLQNFELFREQLDPHNKFLNDFTNEILNLSNFSYSKRYKGDTFESYTFKRYLFLSITSIVVIIFSYIVSNFPTDNSYRKLR